MKKFLCIIICALVCVLHLSAQNTLPADSTPQMTSTDTVIVSVLTCSPGTRVYELYGHTALRVREVRNGYPSDWVFNYGSFSFEQPHFAWNFMLGKTDYELAVQPFPFFLNTYVSENRSIDEQVLNLTSDEARQLVQALSVNLLPDSATYRYNFFYDNCTTRAVRMVEKALKGKVQWSGADEGKTLRDIVHEYSATSPWYKFGQDLLLGAEADRPATLDDQMFAPIYAEHFLEKAQVRANDGSVRPLVYPTQTILQSYYSAHKTQFPSPLWVFGTLLVLTLAVCAYEYKKQKYYWAYDALLWVAQGLTGCIIAFLFFFSSHPTVGSNWLVGMFNPLPLLLFPWFMKAAAVHKRSRTIYVEALCVLASLIGGVFCLQSYPVEIYLIIVILVCRMAMHIYQTRSPHNTQ